MDSDSQWLIHNGSFAYCASSWMLPDQNWDKYMACRFAKAKYFCVHPDGDITLYLLKVWSVLILSMFEMLFLLSTLPSIFRIARTKNAFLIFLQAIVSVFAIKFQQTILTVEAAIGRPLPITFDLYIQNWCYNANNHLYILLALNRMIAIFMPFNYGTIFSHRHIIIYSAICWLLSILYSSMYYWNWPWSRCIVKLNWSIQFFYRDYPERPILEIFADYYSIFKSMTPMPIYLIAAIKFLYNILTKKDILMETSDGDRVRMFLICMLSSLPNFMGNWYNIIESKWGWGTANVLLTNIIRQCFGHFDTIHQPLFLLLLSPETRKEYRKDMVCLARWAKKWLCPCHHRSSGRINGKRAELWSGRVLVLKIRGTRF